MAFILTKEGGHVSFCEGLNGKGSYIEDVENSEPITPSELEQYQQALQEGLSEVSGTIQSMTDLIDEVQTKLDNGEFVGEKGDKRR